MQWLWIVALVGKANSRLARFQGTVRAKQSGSSMNNNDDEAAGCSGQTQTTFKAGVLSRAAI